MSAYIVEDATINRIVTTIFNMDDYYTLELRRAGFDINCLGLAMLKLNWRSVEERYNDGDLEEYKALEFTFKEEKCSLLQAHKSLACFLYQSCEGKCDQDMLYLLLEKIHNGMAHELVQKDPRYDGLKWG